MSKKFKIIESGFQASDLFKNRFITDKGPSYT